MCVNSWPQSNWAPSMIQDIRGIFKDFDRVKFWRDLLDFFDSVYLAMNVDYREFGQTTPGVSCPFFSFLRVRKCFKGKSQIIHPTFIPYPL